MGIFKDIIKIILDYLGPAVIFAACVGTVVVWVIYDQVLEDQEALNPTEVTGLLIVLLILFGIIRLGYKKLRG